MTRRRIRLNAIMTNNIRQAALGLFLLALMAKGQSSFIVEGEELLRQPPAPVSRAPLQMAALPGERMTGADIPSCVGGTWRHGGASTVPVLAAAPLDAQGVIDLQNLRGALQALNQYVKAESADRVYAGVPIIRGPNGLYRDNIVKRSQRDIDAVRERAAQSAAHVLEKFMRSPGRTAIAARGNGSFVSPRLPPGAYVLCGTVRFRDGTKRVGTALDLAVWWTPFTVATNEQMRYALEETNAIGWDVIFR